MYPQGLESGFGNDDAYNVYDKAWRKDQGLSSQLYRPRGERETAEDIDSMIKTRRWVFLVPFIDVLIIVTVFQFAYLIASI